MLFVAALWMGIVWYSVAYDVVVVVAAAAAAASWPCVAVAFETASAAVVACDDVVVSWRDYAAADDNAFVACDVAATYLSQVPWGDSKPDPSLPPPMGVVAMVEQPVDL
jgi:hypothetical protein